MGVMDMFTRPAATPAAAKPDANAAAAGNNQSQQPQKAGTDNSGNQNNAPVKGGANGQTTESKEPANPMDRFTGMFDTKTSGDDKGPPQFSLDKTKLAEAAKAQDFTAGLDPALMQKATSGDMTALMQVIGEVGRNAYQASLDHTSQLTGKFVEARAGFDSANVAKGVKSELTVHALGDTPNFQHPVVKKQLINTAKLMEAQFPDASPQEIAQMSKDFLTNMAQSITGKTLGKDDTVASKDPLDGGQEKWDKWFDENVD